MQIDGEVSSGTEGGAPAGGPVGLADVTVAVVDDDEVIRSLVRTTFSRLGCPVREYENGRRFLDELADAPPGILFLDLMMPEVDGFAVLESLRERKVETPVVVLSALSKKETVLRVSRAGVKSYMIKPIKPEQLVQKTLEILKANF
jgi:DNA-binding response OmpR family regulator